jgi:phage terminase large subunit GpA-like protein
MHALLPTDDQRTWLWGQFDALPETHQHVRPSAWAEERRYLPPSVTSLAGHYSFEVAPYLREILDCLGVDSPVREVVVMKGAQIGATVGILENAIGYFIDHVKSAPCMMVTADAELAKLRLESNIVPMLKFSNLDHLIRSSDEVNTRKTGRTDKKIEWVGGGYLIPFGAQNANKLRSISIRMLLRDEIDGWPDVVGKDGDPVKLSFDRTMGFETSRKVLDISTPLLSGQSKIAKRFEQGDQRYYFVRCLKCNAAQTLRWRRVDGDGIISGLVWETDGGRIVPGTVRYVCEECHHPHRNEDKVRLLSPDHGAEWRPTAIPIHQDLRSYHLSALYSPVGMQSWETCAQKWIECWDVERNQPRDMRSLQVFYNNVLGMPFEQRGERVRIEAVNAHRRAWYKLGEIPNKKCVEVCGGPVLVLVCAVDVHGDNLAVSVIGWCRDRRAVLIDYWRFVGDTEQLEDEPTWGRLRKLIESHEYRSDDGRSYGITLTMIDSGYRTDTVYQFCADYEGGVFPVKGREVSPKHQRDTEFAEFTTPTGQRAYGITVDFYKDRWSAALRRDWDGQELQPTGHFNAPEDATDKQLRELTVEVKSARVNAQGERIGWSWHRPSGAANELWDLLVYSNAALDLMAWDYCINELEGDAVAWPAFWDRMLADLEPPRG